MNDNQYYIFYELLVPGENIILEYQLIDLLSEQSIASMVKD